MKPLQTSSGDLLADRRADYAEMLFGSGEAAAAEIMVGALEQAPGWALGWFRLGEMHEATGALDAAAAAWRMALELDAADHAGASLKPELIGRSGKSSAPPSPFVEALFDGYAHSFEASLVGKLGYRAPALLAALIERHACRRFGLAIDLGCGTGLMGERLRPFCDRLEGVDIPAGMLRIARAKGVYDRLMKADLHGFALDAAPDLVTAADVFIYVGAMESLVASVAEALAPGGLFAFSVETHDRPQGYVLRACRRYAHSRAYVVATREAAGLRPLALEHAGIRMELGASVAGLLVVAGR